LIYTFLIPLLIGFTFNSLSAFTCTFSQRLGEQNGRVTCIILRDVLGIPVWAIGYAMVVNTASGLLFTPTWLVSLLAGSLMLAGVAIIIIGLVTIGKTAFAPSTHDALVSGGIYAHIRHPLYSGLVLELAGLFLYIPKMTVLAACLLGVGWVLIQARLEEQDLRKRMPAYEAYMAKVPRFIPRLVR
jgi:protein-S-isoprenylcysteine O-methyltransferase Ste14